MSAMDAAPTPAEQRRGPGRRTAVLLLGLILVCQAGFHAAWFAQDARIPFWDQMRYWRMSEAAIAIVRGETPGGAGALLDLHASHPPLYGLAGALAAVAGDGSYAAARHVNMVLAALSTLGVFLLARCWLGRGASVLAAALAAALPYAAAFTHLYYTENLLSVLVVFTALSLVASRDLTRYAPALTLGLLMGLGLLTKWTYPIFVGPLVLVAVLRGRRAGPALAAAATALVIAAPWYLMHLNGILEFFASGVQGGEGHLSAVTGLAGTLFYPKAIVFTVLGLPFAVAAALGAVVLWRRAPAAALTCCLPVLAAVLVFAGVQTKGPRHVLPGCLPLAIPAAAALLAIRPRMLSGIVTGLVLLHVVLGSWLQSFGLPGPLANLDRRIPLAGARLPLLVAPEMPGAPDDRIWPHEDLVQSLLPGLPQGGRGWTLLNLTEFREEGFRLAAEALPVPLAVSLAPFSYPPGFANHEPWPLVDLLRQDFLFAKAGQSWIRFRSRTPVHGFAARLDEALFDPGPVRDGFVEVKRMRVPDGSMAIALVRNREAGPRALALEALRWEPAHADAWELLGEPVPSPADLPARLVALGVMPPKVLDAARAEAAGDAPTAARLRLEAAEDHPLREDLWLAAAAALPRNDPRLAGVQERLAAWESWRTREGSADVALGLARHEVAAGHRRAAIRWLRRALEADLSSIEAVRRELQALDPESAAAPDLESALRALDAG